MRNFMLLLLCSLTLLACRSTAYPVPVHPDQIMLSEELKSLIPIGSTVELGDWYYTRLNDSVGLVSQKVAPVMMKKCKNCGNTTITDKSKTKDKSEVVDKSKTKDKSDTTVKDKSDSSVRVTEKSTSWSGIFAILIVALAGVAAVYLIWKWNR
ncbi:hypothetical protein [Pontibacter sp. SGAir0037]|uniref:hypothetical protein n=1 Tax=Pontibacter sp. SGAir0037 TaxID=2571030 RepID=UPI0010CCF94C|nr:hypothetical protein [Pontibacter sp. SGAir0037]QCR23072.1 hypothetical protein C1N53_12440 [Pontibacter sp. SGAir0037]